MTTIELAAHYDTCDNLIASIEATLARIGAAFEADRKGASRHARAAHIAAQAGSIQRKGNGWLVESQGQPGTFYRVDDDGCTCADYRNRQPESGCKHMRAVALHRAARKAEAEQAVRDIWG